MDVADCEFKGQAIGWHSPAGFRHPGLHEYEGEDGLAFVRSFSGLVATCGLDHILGRRRGAGRHATTIRGRATVRHSLHGRVSTIPARLTGYGESLGGRPLRALGRGRRPAVGDVRRGPPPPPPHRGRGRRQRDPHPRQGGQPRLPPHAAHVLLPRQRRLAAARGGRALPRADPRRGLGVARRQPTGRRASATGAWPRRGRASASRSGSTSSPPTRRASARSALVNDRLGLGFEVVTRKDQLPCFYQWQNFQAGHYALGIEPSTHHVLGNIAARERGEMIWLEHGESRSYELTTAGARRGRRDRRGGGADRRHRPGSRRTTSRPPSGKFPALAGRPQTGARHDDRSTDRPPPCQAGLQPRRREHAPGGRDRAGVGGVVPHRGAAQDDEGADAALRPAGDPRHAHLVRRPDRLSAAGGIWPSGGPGGACRSSPSTACSTARPATRAGTNAATAPPSRRAG